MGDDDEDYSEFPEFSDALRKLGWLSTYSRQVLLTRHMLRTFQDEDVVEEMLWRGRDQTALDCFRLAITVFSGLNTATKQFSAPYEPQDRPDTYHLAYSRKRRVFSQSEISGLSSLEFHTLGGGGFGFDNSSPYALEDMHLIEEINTVAKGVTLSTKAVGDKRAKQLITRGLWLNDRVYDWVNYEKFFNEWLPHTPRASDFWRRWIRGVYDGEPLDWNLQLEVAKIDEAIWEEGVEAVAAEIGAIEARLLAEKTRIAEIVVYEPNNSEPDDLNPLEGQFNVVSTKITQTDALERAVSKVEDSFGDAVTLGHGQHVRDASLEGLILNRIFSKYRSDPHRVEMDFEDVRRVLIGNICTVAEPNRNYPDCAELQVLVRALLSASEEIRAAYPDIAQARAELDAQDAISPLPDEVKEQISKVAPVLRAISHDRMLDGMNEDIPELLDDAISVPNTAPTLPAAGEKVREPRKSVLRRFTYRISEIRIELGKLAKATAESPEGQIAGLIGLIGGILSLLSPLF